MVIEASILFVDIQQKAIQLFFCNAHMIYRSCKQILVFAYQYQLSKQGNVQIVCRS